MIILLEGKSTDRRRDAGGHAKGGGRVVGTSTAALEGGSLPVVAKIHALMSQRYVFSAARRELAPDAFSAWCQEVVAVQQAIYRIDAYYEQHTRIETAGETPMWSAVEGLLSSGSGRQNPRVWAALADLRRYADAERRIHVMDPIDPLEFETILSLKCADVRIARTLIWSYTQRVPETAELTFWTCYDECWELLEDLEDLDEDGHDWNFNFWLYLFMSGRTASAGVESAAALLRRKLVELQEIYQRLPPGPKALCHQPLKRTLVAATTVGSSAPRVLGAIAGGSVIPFREHFRRGYLILPTYPQGSHRSRSSTASSESGSDGRDRAR